MNNIYTRLGAFRKPSLVSIKAVRKHAYSQQRSSRSTAVPVFANFAFAVGFSGSIFATMLLIRTENIWEKTLEKERNQFSSRDLLGIFNRKVVIKEAQTSSIVPQFILNIKDIVGIQWERTLPSQKLTWALIGINTVIFLAWQVPRFNSFLSRHFIHTPMSNRPYTLLTCTFSHKSLLHFGFNMMALNGFLPGFMDATNMSAEQGFAFYLSAGVLSSFASHLFSVMYPWRAVVGSLGASGAVWALLTGVAYYRPKSEVGIIFIPGVRFTMDELIPFLILFDVAGLMLKWGSLDHAAHLGGALFGYIYSKYGIPFWSHKIIEDIKARLENHRSR